MEPFNPLYLLFIAMAYVIVHVSLQNGKLQDKINYLDRYYKKLLAEKGSPSASNRPPASPQSEKPDQTSPRIYRG